MTTTSVSANTSRMIDAADGVTAATAWSDLRHRFTSYRVGDIVEWRQLFALNAAAGAFTEVVPTQLATIAAAITLGANDVRQADVVFLPRPSSSHGA